MEITNETELGLLVGLLFEERERLMGVDRNILQEKQLKMVEILLRRTDSALTGASTLTVHE